MKNQVLNQDQYSQLLKELNELILISKQKIENFAKKQLITTYWQIGKKIDEAKLTENAGYSSLIFGKLAEDLQIDRTTLNRAIQFFKTYPENPPKESNLTWSHYRYLLTINDSEIRDELENKAKEENWSALKMNEKLQELKTTGDSLENSSGQISRPTKANYLYKAKIVNVIDGDTLLLNIDLGFSVIKEQRVRLAQIDAPEIKTLDGQKSFEYLRDLAATLEIVVIRTNKIDIYGRYIGDVFYSKISEGKQDKVEIFENGIYLNQQILANGFAKIM